MHCTNCAAEVAEQRKFCGQCGAAVVRRCLACGAANPALNKFCGDCGTKLRVDSPAVVPTARDSRPIERRQLTVLFCDLVGSTALSARLDPEDFSAIIGGYRRCITETVACFDGFVARHHGDGAVVYFGYPEAALKDADCALMEARQIEHAATLMFTLNFPILINTYCGNYDAANESLKELVSLAEEKGAPFRKAEGVLRQGYVLTLTGKATKAVEMVTSGIDLWRSAGSTIFTPEHEFMLAIAHADSGQFDDAWRCIDKAMTAMRSTKERWCEAEAHRVAGEIALRSPQRDVAKAQAHFEHSLTLARAQQAKSWELRAAMSLARLLSDQGKRQTARDLLAPIYDWFTEGFDTSDLRKAKTLLGELH